MQTAGHGETKGYSVVLDRCAALVTRECRYRCARGGDQNGKRKNSERKVYSIAVSRVAEQRAAGRQCGRMQMQMQEEAAVV